MTNPDRTENVIETVMENRMGKLISRARTGALYSLLMLATALSSAGCRENPIVERANLTPVAVAWVVGEDFPEDADVRPTVLVPYDGAPVEVRLDGTHSSDSDGHIVTYRWLSATMADGGGRLIPGFEDDDAGPTLDASNEDEGRGYPADEAKPRVMLSQGFWSFALWVIDERGGVSSQDTVTIQVGDTGPAPDVLACMEGVIDVVSDACQQCICSGTDDCRTKVVACNEDCWGLIGCVADNCPDFSAMSASGDLSCYAANCTDFMSGSAQAQAAGPCITPCAAECATP